jgi:hypothetical protein
MPKAPDEEEHAPDLAFGSTEDEEVDEVKRELLVPQQLRVPPEFKNRMLVHLRVSTSVTS